MKLIICDSKMWFSLDSTITCKNEIRIINKKKDLNFEILNKYKPEFIFFVHWNWKVPQEIHHDFNCVLFHTAPLPYGRGGTPIQNLIIRGYTKSPVYVLKMIEEIDAGPIFDFEEISLKGKLSEIFARLNFAINNLIRKLITNKVLPREQIGDPYIFDRLTEKDNEIPTNLNILEIYDRIRMLDDDSYPNAYIKFGKLKIEFFNASINDKDILLNCKISECKLDP